MNARELYVPLYPPPPKKKKINNICIVCLCVCVYLNYDLGVNYMYTRVDTFYKDESWRGGGRGLQEEEGEQGSWREGKVIIDINFQEGLNEINELNHLIVFLSYFLFSFYVLQRCLVFFFPLWCFGCLFSFLFGIFTVFFLSLCGRFFFHSCNFLASLFLKLFF